MVAVLITGLPRLSVLSLSWALMLYDNRGANTSAALLSHASVTTTCCVLAAAAALLLLSC